ASLLVAATRDPVSEISARCGFGHVGSFERAFSEAFAMTPRQARARGFIPPALLAPKTGEYTMFPTEIRTADETVIAALPHKGAYQDIGSVFGTLAKELNDRGLWAKSGPSFGIYYDDPSETPVDALRSHAGQRLAPGVDVPDGFDRVVLPGGEFLVLTCKGPYSKLPEAWAYLYAQAIPEAGRQFREGLPYERYVTNAWETKPEDHVTEIWVPIA
ncbi:MAG: AraC family transcriptional regulator, partial [Pseudomonadota bacterium]